MGIFSFLGKKERSADGSDGDEDLARQKPEAEPSRPGPAKPAPRNAQVVQRDAARATAEKIDAIESEMTSELVRPARAPAAKGAPRPATPSTPAMPTGAAAAAATVSASLPAMGMTTDFLLGNDTRTGTVEIANSDTPSIIEEAAILFANEQNDIVEQMLRGAIHDAALGESALTLWHMLFDLYRITGKQQPFENLSLEYAAKFETSPPPWDNGNPDAPASPAQSVGAAPAITFSGKLDDSIVKQLERAQKLSEKTGVLRLEFSRVSEVLPAGCELLLATLKKLQKAGYELILVGAPELAGKIRAIVEVGRRDDTQAPWLLLLEILQLLNRESEFEETSIDYCVTYEVSPPAFVAPKKVSTAIEEASAPEAESETFKMPAVIDGRSNAIASISEFAAAHDAAVLDCSRLTRVDFSAAGQLLSALAPVAAQGKTVELQHVNHLVAAMFQVMGLGDIARISLRKN